MSNTAETEDWGYVGGANADTFYASMSLLREMLDYATEAGDVNLVSRIISKHQPKSVNELREIHAQYRRVTPVLEDGAI